jgi:hypothetical protein
MEIVSLVLSFFAFVISIVAIIITFCQFRVERENLSLDMFLRSLEQIGTNEARAARSYIYKFQDLTLPQTNQTAPNPEDKTFEITYDVKTELKTETYTRCFVVPSDEDWKQLTDAAVRIDRIGFIMFNIDLPPKMKTAYLEWWCSTIVDLWNRLAPYISLRRLERENYTPYFDKIAIEAFPYYQKRKRDAKLILLKK